MHLSSAIGVVTKRFGAVNTRKTHELHVTNNSAEHMEIAIAGAGISGLSVAQMLKDKHRVTVYEAEKKGGLIRCETHQGHLYHLVGGHVFNSKNKAVLNWFWSFFDRETEFLQAKRNAKIWMNGGYVGYPIENYLYQLQPEQTQQVIGELLCLLKETKTLASFDELCRRYGNFSDFLEQNFGKTLFELYFRPYNQKVWQQNLKQIPLQWLAGKLPMPNIEDTIQKNIRREEEDQMVHARFFYPKQNGSQFIVERLSQGILVKEHTPISSIEWQNGKLMLNQHKLCNTLVYTGSVAELPSLVRGPIADVLRPFASRLRQLASNGTTNVLCEVDESDLSWLYLPAQEQQAHRIIYTGNFSDSNNSSTRKSCTVEFSGKLDEATAYAQLAKLPGSLRPIALHYKAASYVLHKVDTADLIRQVKQALLPFNIYLLGRFAEWEYYNMDKCMEAAMRLAAGL